MNRRLAVVTGGAKGIGLAISRTLAAAGMTVMALGQDEEALQRLSSDGRSDENPILARRCDVTDEASVKFTFGEIGPVHVLINNAGVSSASPLHQTALAEWERQLRVNATGAFLCTRAVLPGMRESGWGRIVMIASTASHVGEPYVAAYAASKHALLGLMRVLSAEVVGTGITANAVCPTFTRTDMTERSIASIVEKTGRSPESSAAALAAKSPLGRLLEPEEVAAAVAYLVSDDAAAINGQSLVLDGGGIQR